jgi:ligand-binding SRPBCC domain-containing protein
MPVHYLQQIQKIPASHEVVWNFFADPGNLAILTPEYLNLKYTNQLYGEKMYPGQVLTYKVKPLFGVSVFWMTEITHVEASKYFIDEQRIGPYSLWHHQHHFKEIPGGVEMCDIIHYKNPLGPLGALANILLVRKKLEGIFEFRRRKIEEIFGKMDVIE